MAEILRECVELLLNLLSNSEQLSDTKDVINNISNYFQEEHTRAELDLALSILLNEHDSLIYFVKRAVTQPQFKHVIENALEVVQNLISRHVDKMGQYFLSIKEACVSCTLSENTTADCKDKAYQIVVALIENKSLLPPNADLGVQRLLNTVKRELSITKKVPTVQKRLYQLCGILAEHYPVEVSSHSHKFMKQLIYELDQQTHHTNDVQMQVITGCLWGLTGMLVNFTQDYQENPDNCRLIYKCIKIIIENDEVRKRVAHRAALGLLSRHMQQFWAFVYDDYVFWLTTLQRWALKVGDDRKAGLLALETLYVEISNHLASSDTNKDREVLRYFIKHYTSVFKSLTAPQHDVTLAIKGFGKLSRACQRLMNQEDVVFMFTLILQRVQQIIMKSEGETNKNMNNLSDYLESLSDISRELDVLTEEHLLPLKQICILTVEHYPVISSNFQYTVVNAVMVTVFNISLAAGDHIVQFLEDIVYQVVIRMCGHPLVQDAELQKEIENKKNVVTYKSYLPFWKDLFNIKSALNVNRPEVTSEIRQNLLIQLYDALIITLMKLIRRLDLSVNRKTTDSGEALGGQCDPQSALKANSPNDVNVFCNLVDLYSDLLTKHHCEHIARWLPNLSHAVISQSIKFPLISGFYKLLSAVLQAADTINYFKCNTSNREDREQVMQLINRFIVDLLVQLQQYKGDLQMSCLQVILSAPVQLIQSIISLQAPDVFGLNQLSKALQVVFQVGYSYLALAHRGMDALERWHSQLPPDVVKPLFNKVLPYLDPFLQSTGNVGSTADSSDAPAVPKSQRLKQNLEAIDTELSRLQNRILDLLSRLDTPTCLSLLHKEKTAVKWSSEDILSLDIPFADIRPMMYLDSLAPRVMELALSSSDRQTRCLACDVFHSLITVYLGNSYTWEATKGKAVKAFLKKVLPSLLQLGCDPDSYVQQLFHPLVMQIAHYYSSKMMLKSLQTNVFIEALFDGLTHETDTAIRDFSALCLKEFIKWSIKQSSPEELKSRPFNIENIVKRINAYCVHPCIYKRLGAALAFNNLYVEMREEAFIVDTFWLNILYHFVQSLALYDYKDSHQIIFALDHVKRVIVEGRDIFNQASRSRRIPPGLKSSLLKDNIEWLLVLCSSKRADCRHACMSLTSDLAPYVTGCTHLKDFINDKDIIRICEGGGDNSILCVQPESQNMISLLSWLQHLLAALDCYTWLIKKDVLLAMLPANSSILSSLRYFVSEISLSRASFLQGIQGTSPDDGSRGNSSISDENVFTISKCSVIIHLFEFVVAVNKINVKLETFWDQSFWSLVGWCVLRPSTVGFDWSNQPLVDRLCDVVLPLLTALRNQLSEKQFREFSTVIESLLEIDCSILLAELKQILTVGDSVSTRTTEFIRGVSTLHKCGHFSSLLRAKGWIGENIIRAVFTTVTDSSGCHAILEPQKLVYADSLLKLAHELGPMVEVTLNSVLDSSQLEGRLTKGKRFFSLFLLSVVDHMLQYPDECTDALFKSISDYNVEIILHLLRRCQHPSKVSHGQSDKIVTNIVNRWSQLVSWASNIVSRKQTVLHVAKRISATYEDQVACLTSFSMLPVKMWLLNQMSLDQESASILFKAEVLLLLPCAVSQDMDKEDTDLRRALDSLCSQFPVSCSELPETSVADIVKIFKQLLYGLQRTGSPIILRAIISASAHDNKHPCRDDIHSVISKTMERLPVEKQLALIELAYSEYNANGDVGKRLGILHTFLLKLVQAANYDTVLQFFISHISSIMSSCEVSRKTLEMHNGWDAKQQMIGNIGSCYLIEIMFSSLDESDLLTQGKPLIVASGVKQEEKGLMKDVIKKMHGVLSNAECPMLSSHEFKELFRLYMCAAYSALISCIVNCVTEDKLEKCMYTYTFMLTKNARNPSVWELIVPLDKTFTFPVLYSELPKRRKHLVEIKRKAREENKNQDFMHTVQYLHTQSLYNSTLVEDIREFDFTAYSVRDINEKTSGNGKFARNAVSRMEVELDCGSSDVESLCNHECMPILCATVQYLIKLRMPSSEEQPDGNQVPPDWMRCLVNSLRNSRHVNVKTFILHLIINCQKYLKPYAHVWLSPVLEAITRDKCFGTDVNAMIHEIVVMMGSWSSHAIPNSSEQEKHYASEFLEFLVKNTHHDRKDVRVYNLQIVRVIVELWKQCLQLPYQLLYDVINPSGGSSTVTGIQLTATMLANGLLPFSSTGKTSFYDALLANLSKDDRSVYHPCAESIGHILRLLCASGNWSLEEQDDLFYGNVCNKLKTDLIRGSKGGPMKEKKQIICIHAIQKNYPPIVNVFTTTLLNWAPRIPFTFRVMILEALTTALDFDLHTEAFKFLIEADLLKFISGRDSETLKAALQLVNKLIHQLEVEELKILLPEIFKVSNHSDKQCRALVYNILAWFHDNHYRKAGNEDLAHCVSEGRKILIGGLADPESELQEKIYKFWSENGRLSNKTHDRVTDVLTTLYVPENEDIYIYNATYFLLDVISSSPGFSKKIFHAPLSNCKFEDYKPTTSWRVQYASHVPFFTQTLASQFSDSLGSLGDGTFRIRATQQSLAFQPTVDIEKNEPSSSFIGSVEPSLKSSFLFSSGSSGMQARKHGVLNRYPTVETSSTDSKPKLPIPRRQFIHDKERISKKYAAISVRRADERKRMQADRVRKREAQVSVSRSYRRGDLPDIEIPFKDVIRPLQELSKRDAIVAKQVFVLVFKAIKEEIKDICTSVSFAIVDILNSTKHCVPAVIGMLLEIIIADTTVFPVDENRLTEISKNSKQLSLGALLLENKIIKKDSEGLHPPPAKKMKSSEQSDSWVHLAKIYKNMGEMDVVQGIFEDKINSDYQHVIKKAVQYESQGLWKDAQETYQEVTNLLQSALHEDFVYQAYYKCSAYLSEWTALNKAVKDEARDNVDNIWENSWYVDNLLPWYFTSEIHCILSGKNEEGHFLSVINRWLNDAKKADHIKTRFGEQLCIVYLLKSDIQHCKLASEQNLKNFVLEWSQLDVYAEKLKIQKLAQLQAMMEIHHYVSLPPVLTDKSLKSLSHYWMSSSPTNSDSLLNWLTRALYRNYFASQIENRDSCVKQENLSALSKAEIFNQLSLIDCALTQRNFYVARRYLGNTKNKVSGLEKRVWTLNYSKAFLLRSQLHGREDSLKDIISFCTRAWEILVPLVKESKSMEPSLQFSVYQHVAHISNTVSSLLTSKTSSDIQEIEGGTLRVLHEIIGSTDVSSDRLHDHFYKKAINSLKEAVSCAVCNMEGNADNPKLSQYTASAYLELAKLCLQKVSPQNETVLIESLLRAMSYGSREARQLFPCLLQLDSIETINSCTFIDESHKVPEWMFLHWVNQLLSTLDTRKCTVVAPTLYRLARAYPIALQFPFQLTLELYKNVHNSNKAVVDELYSLLQCDEVTASFLQALTCLCQPRLLLDYHIKKLYQAIDHGEEEVKKAYRLLIQESFPSDVSECIKGSAFDHIKNYKADIDKALEYLKGPVPNRNRTKQELKDVQNNMKSVPDCKRMDLEAFSPWLRKFNPESCGHIEIPGQYTGECRPDSQYHITISKFKEKVKVMNSVRQPIRLTILGNDAKEYKFLIKFGEDLRQDQRIQQLFSLMNQILSNNPGTASKQLYIDTYDVIPLNSRLGMIEWVHRTKPLQSVMLDSEALNVLSSEAKDDYVNWMSAAAQHKSGRGGAAFVSVLHKSALSYFSREETVASFRRRQRILPNDMLRNAVFKMSSSLESFMYIRSQMLTSHSVMCICHWLLGIGDRHLNNTLVSLQTGRFLGIDFGYAFGAATDLSVPELIPFRMTPCIVNLAAPMYLAGLLQETMVHVLQTLRQNHMVLSATMQVFIEEPTVNWLEAVQTKSKEDNLNSSDYESSCQWYAKHKILAVKSKLQGAHPCKIMEDDLMLSIHKGYQYIAKLKQLLWRNDGNSKRMDLIAKEQLSAREQVECLLDQATDEHILGKGYVGLELWI